MLLLLFVFRLFACAPRLLIFAFPLSIIVLILYALSLPPSVLLFLLLLLSAFLVRPSFLLLGVLAPFTLALPSWLLQLIS